MSLQCNVSVNVVSFLFVFRFLSAVICPIICRQKAGHFLFPLDACLCDIQPTIIPQLLYEELHHMDICHFVILECRHLANGCVLKCGCIGLMLFRNLSCLGTIIC